MPDEPGTGPDHMWRLVDVELGEHGAVTTYSCDLCPQTLLVPPGGAHPETV